MLYVIHELHTCVHDKLLRVIHAVCTQRDAVKFLHPSKIMQLPYKLWRQYIVSGPYGCTIYCCGSDVHLHRALSPAQLSATSKSQGYHLQQIARRYRDLKRNTHSATLKRVQLTQQVIYCNKGSHICINTYM